MKEIHKCQCGFEWQHGMSGSHMCEPHYRKQIEALKKQRDALAVENESLKAYRPQPGGMAMMEALDAFEAQDDYPEGGMMDAFEILCCKRAPTPATDAAIAAIQAHGVDAFAAWCGEKVDFMSTQNIHDDVHLPASQSAKEYAAQLRNKEAL